jgi:hypothetical protein
MPAQPLLKQNYLAMIRNAAKGENHLFQNFYILLDGQQRDSLRGGALGCGVVVSSILYLQNSSLEFAGKPHWIQFVHANVLPTERDMETHGWIRISDLRPGAVIVWEPKAGADGTPHWHMGFSVGDDRAVSNGSNSTLMPEEHHATYEGTRKIERIWWHPILDE